MGKEPKEPEELQTIDSRSSYLKIAGIIDTYKLLISTESRLKKGYLFEKLVVQILSSLNVEYKSNPIESFALWLFNTNSTYDLELFGEKIEIKYNSPNTKLYKSYLVRDWIPRTNIIVTNDDSPIWRNKKLLKYLKRNGKRVFSLSKFIRWVKGKIKSSITRHIVSMNRSAVPIKVLRLFWKLVHRGLMVSSWFLKAGFSPPFKVFHILILKLLSGLHKSLSKLSKTIGGIIVKMRLEEFFEKFMAQAWKKYRHLKLREAKEKREELVKLFFQLRDQKHIQLQLGQSSKQELLKRKLELLKIKAQIYTLNKLIDWRQYQMVIMQNKPRD